MTPARSRVVALVLFAAVAILAAAALRLGPKPSWRAPGELLVHEPKADSAAVLSMPWLRVDTLGRGESLEALFESGGLGSEDAIRALQATGLNDRRIPAGLEVRFSGDSALGGDPRPREIALQLTADRVLHLTRERDGWTAHEELMPWTTDTFVVHGVVRSTLYDALDQGAGDALPKRARAELAWALADLYEYRVDMSRDLQDGDSVRVVFERQRTPTGLTRIGAILVAGVERSGDELRAIRFLPHGAERAEYYDQTGRSLRASFLRAPLAFRRISSVFGLRKHPILGDWRAHRGTDYAAAAGTPVRSIGDGVVLFAGRRGGYGNSVDVRHVNGMVSRYGHLRAFATGIRSGTHVSMGATIGYVGMTGLATAPHLHFEILVGGVQRDPRTALKANAGVQLAQADLPAFGQAQRDAERLLATPVPKKP